MADLTKQKLSFPFFPPSSKNQVISVSKIEEGGGGEVKMRKNKNAKYTPLSVQGLSMSQVQDAKEKKTSL